MKRLWLLLIISLLALIPVMPTQAGGLGNQLDTERYILQTNPVLYYPLWQKDGTRIASNDGYGHTATLTGTSYFPQGRTFDGTANKITIPDHSALDGMSALTVELWLYPTDFTWRVVFAKYAGIGDRSYSFNIQNSSLLNFNVINASDTSVNFNPTHTMALNTWVHLVALYDGAKMYVFQDTNQIGTSASQTGLVKASTPALVVGAGTDNNYKGSIGEVRIYSRALSAGEIQRNYLSTKWRYQ